MVRRREGPAVEQVQDEAVSPVTPTYASTFPDDAQPFGTLQHVQIRHVRSLSLPGLHAMGRRQDTPEFQSGFEAGSYQNSFSSVHSSMHKIKVTQNASHRCQWY